MTVSFELTQFQSSRDPNNSAFSNDTSAMRAYKTIKSKRLYTDVTVNAKQKYNNFESESIKLKNDYITQNKALFQTIWQEANNRLLALEGHEAIYTPIMQSHCNITATESVLAEIAKIISIAQEKVKKCIYINPNYSHDDAEVEKLPIELANIYSDKLYFKFQNAIMKSYQIALKSGMSFLHLDYSGVGSSDSVQIDVIDYNRIMFDASNIPSCELHKKADIVLIEEFISKFQVNTRYGTSDLIENAINTSFTLGDTFPFSNYLSMLQNNNLLIKEGKKAKIDNNLDYSYQRIGEVQNKVCKITTIYSREKIKISDENGERAVDNIYKYIYINDRFIKVFDTNSKFIPIIPIIPFDDFNTTDITLRFRSIYDFIKDDLFLLAITKSAIASSLVNGSKSNLIVRKEAIGEGYNEQRSFKVNLIKVNTSLQQPLTDIITQLSPPVIEQNTLALIQLLKNSIKERLNLTSYDLNSANSADQEQIRAENQETLSAGIFKAFDNIAYIFGEILKEFIVKILVEYPEEIIKVCPDNKKELINDQFIRTAISIISESEIKLELASYFISSEEQDIKKISNFVKQGILDPQDISFPRAVFYKALGLSQEFIDEHVKTQNMLSQMQEEKHNMEMKLQELEIKKKEAEIQKILADAEKSLSEAVKKYEESKDIKENSKEEEKNNNNKEKSNNKKNNK